MKDGPKSKEDWNYIFAAQGENKTEMSTLLLFFLGKILYNSTRFIISQEATQKLAF